MKKILIFIALLSATAASAQENAPVGTRENAPQVDSRSANRRWEIGAGASVMQFNRVKFSDVTVTDAGTTFGMELRHAVWGVNLYAARELSNVFALDFQGVAGRADNSWLGQAGLGVQWRLGHYFKSSHIDPYLRIGANYMYKGFDIYYTDSQDGVTWQMANNLNKEGRDRHHIFTVAAGAGTNMWLNDHFGIGIQADYLFVPQPSVANSLRGTVRLMWRFGKRNSPIATLGDAVPGVVRTLPPPPVIIRDTIVVERIVVESKDAYVAMPSIHFDFDSAELRPDDATVIAEMVELLKADTSRRYLLTGYADTRGADAYDDRLSYERARAVMHALVARGVPAEMLKIAGGGKRISHAGSDTDDHVREGDRKVTIELITNAAYWQEL